MRHPSGALMRPIGQLLAENFWRSMKRPMNTTALAFGEFFGVGSGAVRDTASPGGHFEELF